MDISSTTGGNAGGQSAIRAGSFVDLVKIVENEPGFAFAYGNIQNYSGAGMTVVPILTGEGVIPQVTHNEVSSEVYASRSYDGYSSATTSATSSQAESGAWDASVNAANPRTRRASESVYSSVRGDTSARAQTYLGGDLAGSDFTDPAASGAGRTAASIKSLVLHSTNLGYPLYTSAGFDPANPVDNGFCTNASSQRVTPGADDNRVTSEAFISDGSLSDSGRDELPDTSVFRLLHMNVAGANFGSGAHLVNQATGILSSDAYSFFGASFTNGTGGTADSMKTTHIFEANVAGPVATGNVLDDAGSYARWGTLSGSSASNQSMSRPTYDGINAYASMVTSIAGENAVGWLSGDDSRFHMEARGSASPVISDPAYDMVPVDGGTFTDQTSEPREKKVNLATSRSDKLTRNAAGATLQPENS